MNDSPVSKNAFRLAFLIAILITVGITQFKGGASGPGVAAFLITVAVFGAMFFRRYDYRDGAAASFATWKQRLTATYVVPGALCLGVCLGFIAGLVYAPSGVVLIVASIAGIHLSIHFANLPGRLVIRFLCVGLASGALSHLLVLIVT
jgi:hypothetical protein